MANTQHGKASALDIWAVGVGFVISGAWTYFRLKPDHLQFMISCVSPFLCFARSFVSILHLVGSSLKKWSSWTSHLVSFNRSSFLLSIVFFFFDAIFWLN